MAVQYGTIRYASIFAKKCGRLERYVFFVMVLVRYVGTVRFLCNGTSTVRWYAVWIKNPQLFERCTGFLYAEVKDSWSRRLMCEFRLLIYRLVILKSVKVASSWKQEWQYVTVRKYGMVHFSFWQEVRYAGTVRLFWNERVRYVGTVRSKN